MNDCELEKNELVIYPLFPAQNDSINQNPFIGRGTYTHTRDNVRFWKGEKLRARGSSVLRELWGLQVKILNGANFCFPQPPRV